MNYALRLHHIVIPYVLQNIAWFIPAWPLTRLLLHFKVRGREHVDEAFRIAKARGVGVLFCPNHVSELDPILVLHGLRPFSRAFPMFYVIYTPSIYKDRATFGWRSYLYGEIFFKCWGAHPLNAGKKDYALALAPHVPILTAGYSLMMFPEGKISRTGEAGEAKGGTGYLVLKTSPVVVPVRIDGLAGITNAEFWGAKRHVTLAYGEPIDAKKTFSEHLSPYVVEDCREVSSSILSEINKL